GVRCGRFGWRTVPSARRLDRIRRSCEIVPQLTHSERKREPMANHIFHPPTEMPAQIISFAHGVEASAADFGNVPGMDPTSVKNLADSALPLQPLAEQIAQMEIKLASLKESYNQQALPVWTAFSTMVALAKTFAEKSGKA